MQKEVEHVGYQGIVQKEFFTVYETAYYTGLSVKYIREAIKDNINPLPHFRVGPTRRVIAIRKNELDLWLESFRVADLKFYR